MARHPWQGWFIDTPNSDDSISFRSNPFSIAWCCSSPTGLQALRTSFDSIQSCNPRCSVRSRTRFNLTLGLVGFCIGCRPSSNPGPDTPASATPSRRPGPVVRTLGGREVRRASCVGRGSDGGCGGWVGSNVQSYALRIDPPNWRVLHGFGPFTQPSPLRVL